MRGLSVTKNEGGLGVLGPMTRRTLTLKGNSRTQLRTRVMRMRAKKSKWRKLLCLLRSENTPSSAPVSSARARPRRVTRTSPSKLASLRVALGYNVLVIDTNILLSSLSIFASLVESLCWTILVPLAVITELDGIATNNSSLGEDATAAVQYISSHMPSIRSLKVQTSNYLQTLSIRSETPLQPEVLGPANESASPRRRPRKTGNRTEIRVFCDQRPVLVVSIEVAQGLFFDNFPCPTQFF